MEETTAHALPQGSPALWLLSLLIACAAAHLLMGYVRHARREGRAWSRRMAPWLGMTAFGIGATAAMALALASQAVAYPFGYLRLGVGASAVAAVVGAAAMALLSVSWLNVATVISAAAALGVGCTASGMLLVRSIGLLPGLEWSYPQLGAGAALASMVVGAGLWLGLLGPGLGSRHRRAWRAAAAAVVGVGVVMAQQFVLAAGDMSTQISSSYRDDIGSMALTVAAAAGVPMLLGVLLFDLHMREMRAKLEAVGARRPRGQRTTRRRAATAAPRAGRRSASR